MVSDKIAHTYIIFHKVPKPDSTRSFDFCNWDPISSETIAPADLTFLKVPDTDSSHVLSVLICHLVLDDLACRLIFKPDSSHEVICVSN